MNVNLEKQAEWVEATLQVIRDLVLDTVEKGDLDAVSQARLDAVLAIIRRYFEMNEKPE